MDNTKLTYDPNIMSKEEIVSAAKEIFEAEEKDFQSIINKKWYQKLLNAIAFDKDGKKAVLNNITALSQLQRLFFFLYRSDFSDLSKGLEEVIQNAIDQNKAIEELYYRQLNISRQEDPASMPLEDRELLLQLLAEYSVAGEIPENVQKYNRGLALYLSSGTFAPNNKLEPQNLGNVSKPSIFYRVILEQSAVDGTLESHEWPDSIYDDIEELDLSGRKKRDIEASVKNESNTYGLEYFFTKYSSSNQSEGFTALVSEICTIEENPPTGLFQNRIESINISLIEKGQELILDNEEIFWNRSTQCDGNIILKNCTIHYFEDVPIRTITINSGNIYACNCKFICQKPTLLIDSIDQHTTFIKSIGNSKLEFISCTFENCANFMSVSEDGQYLMRKCEFTNPLGDLVLSDLAEGEISDSVIRYNEYFSDFLGTASYLFSNDSSHRNNAIGDGLGRFRGIIKNCKFYIVNRELLMAEREKNSKCNLFLSLFDGFHRMENCHIENGNGVFLYPFVGEEIYKSDFINCGDFCIGSSISSCSFDQCHTIRGYYDYSDNIKSVKIYDCIFNGCSSSIHIQQGEITCCEFRNCQGVLIEFGSISTESRISSCKFNNVESEKSIIEIPIIYSPFGKQKNNGICMISNCNFADISLKQYARIIKRDGSVTPNY